MTKDKAKEFYPILQAYAEGRVIECRTKPGTISSGIPNEWTEMKEIDFWNGIEYRIKPEQEPKYRPFKYEKRREENGGIVMNNKVKEALGSASYLTYHWRQYSFEQLEKEMVRICGLCDKALGRFKDDSITDFERGQWSVIQNVIGYVENYSLAAELCREAGIGYKKIKALQKDCGYSYKEEVNNFLKESRNSGIDLKLED